MSAKLPATAKTNSTGPRVGQTQAVKARLDPTLNKPYFEPVRRSGGCVHAHYGVKLDKQTQRAYCNKCGEEIALFDALWNYHIAEERLVSTLQSLDDHDKREAAKKQRDAERRPFMRKVTTWTAERDMDLKSEPVVARIYELEVRPQAQDGRRPQLREGALPRMPVEGTAHAIAG